MKKLKILVIGQGGREHALGWQLNRSPLAKKIFFAPGNAGTENLGENIDIKVDEIEKLADFAKKEKIDLTIVGPELPLVLGIVDFFQKKGLNIIGPSKKASLIEGSKIFAKKLMSKYNIPTAKYAIFTNFNCAKTYLKKADYPLVIKADGLCQGKGTKVCDNQKEAEEFLRKLMVKKIFGSAGEKVIIEDCLIGQEISFMVITDGKDFLSFLPSQDHKRLLDNNQGPNTGGMGAYAPVPFVDKNLIKQIEKKIVAPTISALAQEGCLYQGILYPGLILTKSGPKVLEFNCRFGDPETQPLMMLLQSDLLPIFLSLIEGKLKKEKLVFKKGAAVCVILAAKGYPGNYEKGEIIYGLDKIKDKNIQIFHAGTVKNNNQIVTAGGRVLGITGYASSLFSALKKVYKVIGKNGVYFKNMIYRKDIGQKGLN